MTISSTDPRRFSIENLTGEAASADWDRIDHNLRALVEDCAKHVFVAMYRPHQTPKHTVVLGPGPGTYSFSTPEARSFATDVVLAVNEAKKTRFSLTIKIEISWTFGQFIDAVCTDLIDQIKETAISLVNLGAPQ